MSSIDTIRNDRVPSASQIWSNVAEVVADSLGAVPFQNLPPSVSLFDVVILVMGASGIGIMVLLGDGANLLGVTPGLILQLRPNCFF